jgi:hypothetical protein
MTNHKNKLFAGLVVGIFCGTVFQFPVEFARADTLDWIEEGNYFVFEIEAHYTSPDFYNETVEANVTIDELTAGNVTIWEMWYDPSNQSNNVEVGGTYNLTTREAEERQGYFSWLWINSEDLENGTVYIADRNMTYQEETSLYYVLNYSDASGNQSTLYYGKDTLRLEYTDDFVFSVDTIGNSSTSLAFLGQGGGRSQDGLSREPPEDTETFQEGPGSGLRGDLWFSDPYFSDASNWFKLIDRGLGGITGDDSVNYMTGYMYIYGHVYSSGGGEKKVYTYARINGPEDRYFQVSQTGHYDIRFYHLFDGEARTASSWGWYGGAGKASGKVKLYGYLYDTATSKMWSKSKTHYDCFTSSGFWDKKYCEKKWDDKSYTLTISNAYLYSWRTYYFKTQFVSEHYVKSFGFWLGTSWSWVEDDFQAVQIDD